MSRVIDWSKPLSQADLEWASQFSRHHDQIAMNLAEHGTPEGESLDGDDEIPPYSEWSLKDLKAEVGKRPMLSMPPGKPKAEDLVLLLEADDEAAEQAAQKPSAPEGAAPVKA